MFLIVKSVEFYSFYDCNTLICVVIIVKKCRILHEFGNKLQKSGIKIKENWAIYLIILIFAIHLLFGLALIAKNILI